jgi:hypothetical protein
LKDCGLRAIKQFISFSSVICSTPPGSEGDIMTMGQRS